MTKALDNADVTLYETGEAAGNNIWLDRINDAIAFLDEQCSETSIAKEHNGTQQSGQQLNSTSETVHDLGSLSGDVVLDYADGHYQHATLAGNVTSLTINNWPTAGWLTLELTQDAAGGRTLGLGSAFLTPNADGVELSTEGGAIDTLHMFTRDSGASVKVNTNLGWG